MYNRGDVLRNDSEGGVKFFVLDLSKRYYRLLDFTFHWILIKREVVEKEFVFDHHVDIDLKI